MKKYLGNSYDPKDDYDKDNAVNGRVMIMLRLMVITFFVDGDDDIIVIIMMMIVVMIPRCRMREADSQVDESTISPPLQLPSSTL